ncbi:MAG: PKD domain-containing protein [Saprospiraceae bacterium]|nr:PKD domain-containing protein [Saprospiraceae bacterium]
MKNILIFLSTFWGCFSLSAQHSVQKIESYGQEAKQEILSLHSSKQEIHSLSASKALQKFKNYSLFKLKELNDLEAHDAIKLSLNIELPELGELSFDLERTFISQNDAKLYIAGPNGVSSSDLKISPTYSGYIKGLLDSKVYLTLSPDYFAGIIQFSDNEKYVFEPLINDVGVIQKQTLILYKTSDIIKRESYRCLVDDVKNTSNLAVSSPEFAGCYEVDIAQAADYSMWQKYGGYQGVVDRMATIINLCRADYENQFNSKIYLRIAGTWLSSCPTCDPWSNDRNLSSLLAEFRDWTFRDNYFLNINHDISQMWTNRPSATPAVGYGYIRTVCVYSAKNIIQDYTDDLELLRSTVSHELGHNFGGDHDPNGSQTIMAPFSNYSHSWSQKSKNDINPYINELINNKCLFPCTPYHFEYAKIAEEGYRNRDPYLITEQSKFYECEPIWRYWSIDQISPNIIIQGRSEIIYPDGQKEIYDINENSGPNILIWLRGRYEFFPTQIGQYIWNFYQKADNGELRLMATKKFEVIQKPTNSNCSERLFLPFDGDTNDKSLYGNHAAPKVSNPTYDLDRFGNCNSAVKIGNGSYLEVPVINERAACFWFKMNKQEQMVIYDSGPSGEESKDWNISVYKPGGLGSKATFATSYGLFFDTWDRDIAIPFDAIKSGWHFVAVSRDLSQPHNFRIMIDGQFPAGYVFDGFKTVQDLAKFNTQPFSFPSGGYGVPNLHDVNYKTYIGRDSKDTKVWDTGLSYFDGWLDDLHVFGQLLDETEMMALYKAGSTSPLKVNITNNKATCEGQNNGSLTAVGSGANNYTYKWNTGQTTATISNLAAGNYKCTVSGIISSACIHSMEVSATVGVNPKPNASIGAINPSCKSSNNGNATINVTSGTSPYQYKWNNNQTSEKLTNVSAGTYTVTVTDANGCTASLSVTITENPSPSITITNTKDECEGKNNGEASINVNSGKSPYQYKWNNGSVTNKITNVKAGSYSVTVTDANGCNSSMSVNIKSTPKSISDFNSTISTKTVTFTNLSTNANSYLWEFGDQMTSTEKSPIHSYIQSGEYNVCLTAYGCDTAKLCKKVVINPGVATKDLADDIGWSFTPNPSKDMIYLDFRSIKDRVLSVNLYASNGAKVDEIPILNPKAIIEYQCSICSSGLYYIQVNTDQRSSMKKLFLIK